MPFEINLPFSERAVARFLIHGSEILKTQENLKMSGKWFDGILFSGNPSGCYYKSGLINSWTAL